MEGQNGRLFTGQRRNGKVVEIASMQVVKIEYVRFDKESVL